MGLLAYGELAGKNHSRRHVVLHADAVGAEVVERIRFPLRADMACILREQAMESGDHSA